MELLGTVTKRIDICACNLMQQDIDRNTSVMFTIKATFLDFLSLLLTFEKLDLPNVWNEWFLGCCCITGTTKQRQTKY